MNNEHFSKLLIKYDEGNCTPDEKSIVESWYNHWQGNLDMNISDAAITTATQRTWDRIKSDIVPAKKLYTRKIWLAAALLTVIFSAGVLTYLYQNNSAITAQQVKLSGIKPGGNAATLTLADGSTINLATKKGKLASQGNIDIVQSETGVLNYSAAGQNATTSSQAINIIETPKGGEYEILLSDGTKVFLNALSSLRFPVAFSGKERKIRVTGEVYLQVAHDPAHPFIVESNNQKVKVLGTEFNINAYPGQQQTRTALVNGKIEVSNLAMVKYILPGQQAEISSPQSAIKIATADLEAETAWRKGYFRFRNEDIHSVMEKLSRWYDVEVNYTPEISNEKFSGVISRYKNIDEVLEMLEYSKSVHFKLQERRITVSK